MPSPESLSPGAVTLFNAIVAQFGRLLLTTDEAAQVTGFKKSTLEAWRCRGGGPPFTKLGGVKYRADLLAEFLEAGTTRPLDTSVV